MAQRARIDDIIEGMEMQSDTMYSYLHRPTGRVICVSDDALAAAENDDEDLASEEELAEARAILAAESEYLELPDRFEINEYRMMERFAASLDDASEREAALGALGGRGAFRYFKDTMHRLGRIKEWYAYRDDSYRQAAREWCEANDIEFDDDHRPNA